MWRHLVTRFVHSKMFADPNCDIPNLEKKIKQEILENTLWSEIIKLNAGKITLSFKHIKPTEKKEDHHPKYHQIIARINIENVHYFELTIEVKNYEKCKSD